jgi:aminopeptidase N
MRAKRIVSVAIAAAAVLTLVVFAAPASATRYVAGSEGSGDPFFPLAGNGGYDVRHYSLRIAYDQPANSLQGFAIIRARATQSLSRFNLDLRDFLAVSDVTVNFRRASFFQEKGQELVITPRKKIRAGKLMLITVRYSGTPEPVVDPDESIEGWIPTDDGAFVVNEPQGSPGWYPVNDSARDKATYDFRVKVPEGKTVMANGKLISQRTRDGWTTWHWSEDSPMAPYLATATNGTFETEFGTTSGGLPEYNAVDPNTRIFADPLPPPNPELAWERLGLNDEAVEFFSDLYGEYPFSSVGGVVDWAPDVQYALESQTRPMYWQVPDESTVVHEIAHQWFGNAVTLSVWPDIWLNEGFATFSEWIWDERHGGPTAQEVFDERCATPEDSEEGQELWFPAPAALEDATQLFHTPVYDRGAMTLQALRSQVGEPEFFRILRLWYAENRYGNVTTADFIALAERVAGRQLDDLFRAWLYEAGRPAACEG